VKYLDYSLMPDFVNRFFSGELKDGSTLAGFEKKYESGYFDITRFFGNQAANPRQVVIDYIPGEFKFDDDRIEAFAREMEQRLISENRLHTGPPIMKVIDYDFHESPFVRVQKARYGDVAGSCFVLDYPHLLFEKHGGTLREYYKNRYRSHEIKDNPLPLCLGICGILHVIENGQRYFLKVHRSARLASLENSIGPSVAGSVDFKNGYSNLSYLINDALGRELREELNLKKDNYNIIPLAFAREIFRGENPQLFCLVETYHSREEIISGLEKVSRYQREFDSYSFVEINKLGSCRDDESVASLNHEAKMNYYLIEEYLYQSA